jgi:hypothetical protein
MADVCRLHEQNKACPKYPFSLPRIDQVVDLTAGCELPSLLDAYLGYDKIPLVVADQPATTFITPFGCFCYVKISFGLKNARSTYQRCMPSCFKGQIGCNLEVYVNDIVVKTQQNNSLIADPEETFANLRRFNIKLNLEKCIFGVPRGKLLGYIITKHDFKANLAKSRPSLK